MPVQFITARKVWWVGQCYRKFNGCDVFVEISSYMLSDDLHHLAEWEDTFRFEEPIR